MAERRHIYLKMTGAEEALQRLLAVAADAPALSAETLPTSEALGRITAAPIYARASSPPFPAAAMDGYAVQSRLTFSASEAQPVALILPDEAEVVDTGHFLPAGKDAVIKIEDVHEEAGRITIMAAAWPGQHVRLVGEEVTAGDLLVTSGETLNPRHIALLTAAQVWSVPVRRRPVVTLIPTGEECAPAGHDPAPGQFVEYNGPMLSAMVREWGGEAQLLAPVPDDPQLLARIIGEAADDCDVVAVIAGSSAGRRDFVPGVIAELGELLVHGVRMMPGKPVALGRIGDRPIIGLPGYSVAAWAAAERYLKPLLCWLLGTSEADRSRVTARVRRKLPSAAGVEETLRVALSDAAGELTAVPLTRGSAVIGSLAAAQGLLVIPEGREGYDAGDEVEVELLTSLSEIRDGILTIGSHDLALAELAERLAQRHPPVRLTSLSTGSAEGLAALGRGESHLGGTHLLDPETGEYNVSYVRQWLPDLPLVLINLTFRQVGFMVAPGNPAGLQEIADLAREDITFVNRQAGSGTRVLLDYLLREHGVASSAVRGYEREVYTHTMVAEAVRHGGSDVGLGILAAARVFGLDFIPITEERYDLAIPRAVLDQPKIMALLDIVRDENFKQAIRDLGGYSARQMGEVLYEQ